MPESDDSRNLRDGKSLLYSKRNIRPDQELYDLEILIAGSTDMMIGLQVHL